VRIKQGSKTFLNKLFSLVRFFFAPNKQERSQINPLNQAAKGENLIATAAGF